MKDELRWVWLSLAHFKTFSVMFPRDIEERLKSGFWTEIWTSVLENTKQNRRFGKMTCLERNLLEINVGVLESNYAYCDRITWHVWWVLSFIGVTAIVMQTATHQHFRGVLLGCNMQRLAAIAYHTYFIAVHCAVLSRCNPIIVITDIPHYTFLVNTGSLV